VAKIARLWQNLAMGGKSWFWAQIGGLEAKLWFHAHGCLVKCYHEENGHIAAQRVPYAVKEL
jgi:hypothetical protein